MNVAREAVMAALIALRTPHEFKNHVRAALNNGCTVAEVAVPGHPPRHARVLYLCSPAALSTVLRARAELGALSARIEVRDLPPDAPL